MNQQPPWMVSLVLQHPKNSVTVHRDMHHEFQKKTTKYILTIMLLTKYQRQDNQAYKRSHAHQKRAAQCTYPKTFQKRKIIIISK